MRIMSGTYVDQNIRTKTAAAPAVVMQPASGAAVIVKELDVSATWLTIRKITVAPMEGLRASDKILDVDHGADHLKLDRIRLDGRINGVRQVRDGLGISGDTDYVTVQNSDICCVQDQKLIQIQTYGTSVQNRHLTLTGNMIHDDWQTDSGKHLECLWLEGVSDLVLNGNHFYDCALNAILGNADEGGTLANWTIVNNVFEAADAGAGGIPQDIDGCAEDHRKSNWLLAYNYFARGLRFTSCGGELSWLTMRGNIGAAGDDSCGRGGRWEYNIWAQRRCSTTDRRVPNITNAGHYVAAKPDETTGPAITIRLRSTRHRPTPAIQRCGRPAMPTRCHAPQDHGDDQDVHDAVRVEGAVTPSRAGLRLGLTLSKRPKDIRQANVRRARLSSDGRFVAVFARFAPGTCVLSATVPAQAKVSTNGRADAGPYELAAKQTHPLQKTFSC